MPLTIIINNNNRISIAPYGRNFRGAGSRSDQCSVQEAQLMLTTGATRLAVSRGQQTWYHFGSVATFR